MKIRRHRKTLRIALIAVSFVFGALLVVLGILQWRYGASTVGNKTVIVIHELKTSTQVKPALTVTTTSPVFAQWPETLGANGNVAAWQESSIGTEVNGLQLTKVMVDVGDTVHKGQVLAVFFSETAKADVAAANAAVAESEAALAEAKANADRARQVKTPGVISAQQINDYLIAERMAFAKLDSARARLDNLKIRLRQTTVTSPDDGVISSRTAAVGTVMSVGQELFRLIRFNRLEWRGEVTSAEMRLIRVDQAVTITAPGGVHTTGVVRVVGPTIDTRTRMGIVYVDVPKNSGLKAGMFAHGDIELGNKKVMALPQSAVVQREGFSYVYRIGLGNKVFQAKVETDRRRGNYVEITGGLEQNEKVVATGAAFLSDGDTVRIVDSLHAPQGSK